MGQDIRDRFSGAVEAFSRRNASSSARHGEHTRHRSEDAPSSKDVVFVFHIDLLIPHSSLCSVLPPSYTHRHTHQHSISQTRSERQFAWLHSHILRIYIIICIYCRGVRVQFSQHSSDEFNVHLKIDFKKSIVFLIIKKLNSNA